MKKIFIPGDKNKKTTLSFLQIRVFVLVAISIALIQPSSSQSGRVGINTAVPLAGLHVADSSVLFSNPSTSSAPTTIPPPIEGAGSRMMWYSPKKAFRVGTVSGNQWHRDSIGFFSSAGGYNAIASDTASFAFGYNVEAKGQFSGAFGYGSKSLGNSTFAFGKNTIAKFLASIAFGNYTTANGTHCTALGDHTTATVYASLATGSFTKSSGLASSSFGSSTASIGASSACFGDNTISRPFVSFVVGRYNDTTALNLSNWDLLDPVFIIGNGASNISRSNALTILKNGNTGLGTSAPVFRLQVTNNTAAGGGYAQGILIENTNADVGEAAISFRNKSIPSTKQWTIGLDQSPKLAFNYGPSFTNSNTRMVLDTFGRLGINTISPQASLHLVRSSPSGGAFVSNAMAIFESSLSSYIQLSSKNTDETGILSGNQVTAIRNGIVFQADSSIHFRAGGNSTKMVVYKNGNVGVGVIVPTEKLHVNGTVKLGVNGTTITEVIKATVNANLPSVAAGATLSQSFTVTNAALTSAVCVSQESAFADGFLIASARVSAVNTVEVRFVNTGVAAYNPPSMDYYFTIIR